MSLADLLATSGITRQQLADGIGLTTGKVFVILNGMPHRERLIGPRIAAFLDELPSTITAALAETARQAALVAPDLLLQPERLSELRALAGLQQRQLAAKSGVAIMTVSSIENGYCWATASTIHALTRGLGLDPSDLTHLERVRRACHYGCKRT